MGSSHGMNSYTVALIPVAVFSLTGIINKEDLKKISWDVLWLVSGGIALGLALDQTGLLACWFTVFRLIVIRHMSFWLVRHCFAC